MAKPLALRQVALARLSEAFGQPCDIPVGGGESIYRWLYLRAPDRSIYVTLNCPEAESVAHIVVSDPSHATEPVTSLTLHTAQEVDDAITEIERRWPRA